jgi:hypothetical protein
MLPSPFKGEGLGERVMTRRKVLPLSLALPRQGEGTCPISAF